MHRFEPAGLKWWQKPLVEVQGRPLPAELAALQELLKEGESGAWLNSTGTETGVTDLKPLVDGGFRTIRTKLPGFVREHLEAFYAHPDFEKGMYDLVIWNRVGQVRFVEVKCPHWDRQTEGQRLFESIAEYHGIPTSIFEWEFDPSS